MGSENKTLVVKHISAENLNNEIRELEKDAKKVNRLHLIQQLYHGKSMSQACDILKIPLRTGYNWLKKWNDNGLDGLNHSKGAGRPSFLTPDELIKLDEYISLNEGLGVKEIHYFIKNEFNVDYSLKQVRKIIKNLDFSSVKPYPVYEKSPSNAKEILKQSVSEINQNNDIYSFF
jgi:transposase